MFQRLVRRQFGWLAVLAAALLPAMVAIAQGPVSQDDKTTQSRIMKKSYRFEEAGKDMEYALFVPRGYENGSKTPLVVALHGLGSNPQQIMRYRGLTDQAEKHGFIVAAPMGYNPRGWYGLRVSGVGQSGPENLAELSEKDVMNVVEQVRKAYTIDPDRIYLMGHSMGGGGTVHLAVKYPDVWAALAPIAPALMLPMTDLQKIKHIPVILIQGDSDRSVPVTGPRRWAEEMKRLGMTYEYVEVPGGDHMSVAPKNMPNIFDFFSKHRREKKEAK